MGKEQDWGRLDIAEPLKVGQPNAAGETDSKILPVSNTAVIGQADDAPPPPARFKIDLLYDGAFSVHKNNLGVLSLWGSGGSQMPDAEWKIYECPREDLTGRPCSGLITPGSHANSVAACPKCKTVWTHNQIDGGGARLFVLSVDKWAQKIVEYMNRLGLDVDIYLKRFKTKLSIIEAEMKERERQLGGELLNKAREKEGVVYPRDRIITDVASGASLESAVKAFLLA